MKLSQLQNASASDILEHFGADASRQNLADAISLKGLPNKNAEEYRYADIESVMDMDLTLLQVALGDIEPSTKLIITDGVVTHAPDTLMIKYVTAVERCENHFDTLYELGHIASKLVLAIEPEDGVSVEIVHRVTTPKALVSYRVAIYLSENSHVSIYETFETDDVVDSLVIYGYDIFIARDASLKMVKNQVLDSGSCRMFATHRFQVGQNARLDLATFDFGSASSLQTMQIELGQRAHTEAAHLLYASENAKRGTVSKIIHIGEGSTSNQRAKNILEDKARGIFDALIRVEHSARFTKAHQKSNAILLETGAYMASKPQLEIYIDELEASHGSTTGQLDGRQLFYLRSRGIAEVDARKMLIQAFANELIDTIDDDVIRRELHDNFDKAFYGQSRVEYTDAYHGCGGIALSDNSTPIKNLLKG